MSLGKPQSARNMRGIQRQHITLSTITDDFNVCLLFQYAFAAFKKKKCWWECKRKHENSVGLLVYSSKPQFFLLYYDYPVSDVTE